MANTFLKNLLMIVYMIETQKSVFAHTVFNSSNFTDLSQVVKLNTMYISSCRVVLILSHETKVGVINSCQQGPF